LQEKIKRVKKFVQEWLNEAGDVIIENHLKKKINEILESHNIIQELKL